MRRGSSIVARWLGLVCLAMSSVVWAGDWPQWRGPLRDGVSREVGLLRQWPAGGPSVIWSAGKLGGGYGSVSISGNRLYVQGTRGAESVVHCIAADDGRLLWTSGIGPRGDHERGGGPRGTPTVDGERLFVLGESGDLVCLRANTGSTIWRTNIHRAFGGSSPKWLTSESPLIDGENVIVTPGGADAGIVALDKAKGDTVWKSADLSDGAGYSSCLTANVGGIRTILGFTDSAAVGVRAADGKLLWRYDRVANRTANVATPVLLDNKVFYSSAYNTGAALLELTVSGDSMAAREVYFTRDMMNHHGGVVLVDGYLYGYSAAILTCMEFATGKVAWKDRSVGKGSLTYADGHLYLLGEGNTVGLAEASPEAYREKGRFTIEDQGFPSWAHPVVSGGKLYLRNQGTLTCYNIKAPASR